MLRLEHDVDQVSLTEKSDASSSPSPTTARSAPVTPTHNHGNSVDVGYRDGTQRGFFEGLLGCLRPVWTIIGKAAAAELKQQGEDLVPCPCICPEISVQSLSEPISTVLVMLQVYVLKLVFKAFPNQSQPYLPHASGICPEISVQSLSEPISTVLATSFR